MTNPNPTPQGGLPEKDKPRRVTTQGAVVFVQQEKVKTALGEATYIKIVRHDPDDIRKYRRMTWEEVWEAFAEIFPEKWAVQVFPPDEELVNGKHVYHLFVVDREPIGMNIKKGM